MKKEVKKEKKKMGKIELIFTIISVLFLLSCICFYGYRMFYYKDKFSYKNEDGSIIELLSNKLKENTVTSGDGLYNINDNYIYKGSSVNNYIEYSNMLFRIIKINKDNTIEIILDDSLNYMLYDNKNINYKESNLNKYLNDIFYNNIKSDLLTKSLYCSDKLDNINSKTCDNIETDYVKLLSVSDYLNSKIDNKSYLDSENIFWLNNSNNDKVYVLNNSNLSLVDENNLYQVKPVITLNNSTVLDSGDGSKDAPYKIKNDKSYFASYVKLGNDLYRVYDVNSNILKLQTDFIYKDGNIKYNFSNNSNMFSLGEGLGLYMNTKIYDNLSYKDLLEDCNTFIGDYSSYETVKENIIKSKIGLMSIIDPIFNKENNNYYLSTPYDKDNIYIYNDNVYPVKTSIVRNIKYSICINKDKITSGVGSKENPYILGEVK